MRRWIWFQLVYECVEHFSHFLRQHVGFLKQLAVAHIERPRYFQLRLNLKTRSPSNPKEMTVFRNAGPAMSFSDIAGDGNRSSL